MKKLIINIDCHLKEIEDCEIAYKLIYYDKIESSETSGKIYFALGLCGLFLAFILLTTKSKKKDLRDLYYDLVDSGVSFDEIKCDLDTGKRYKNIIIGKKYAIAYSNGTQFVNGDDLAWVHQASGRIIARSAI